MQNEAELQSLYHETLNKLQKGERPIIHLNQDELAFALEYLKKLNQNKAPTSEYLPLLCVLDHSKKGSLTFAEPLAEIYRERNESEILIYSLSAALKVIIEECERQGERIPFSFMKSLPRLLSHKDPEVVEWTLRTIEALGHQSIILKDDVLKARPGLSALFNKHKKNTQELVDYLIKRWSPRE